MYGSIKSCVQCSIHCYFTQRQVKKNNTKWNNKQWVDIGIVRFCAHVWLYQKWVFGIVYHKWSEAFSQNSSQCCCWWWGRNDKPWGLPMQGDLHATYYRSPFIVYTMGILEVKNILTYGLCNTNYLLHQTNNECLIACQSEFFRLKLDYALCTLCWWTPKQIYIRNTIAGMHPNLGCTWLRSMVAHTGSYSQTRIPHTVHYSSRDSGCNFGQCDHILPKVPAGEVFLRNPGKWCLHWRQCSSCNHWSPRVVTQKSMCNCNWTLRVDCPLRVVCWHLENWEHRNITTVKLGKCEIYLNNN